MKVFFIASITGKKDYRANYEIIINEFKKLGHKVFSDHIMKDKCDKRDLKLRKDHRQYSKTIHNFLNKSDIVVSEISHPSLMVGYLLNAALKQRKHILVLYKKNPHRILVGESNKFLKLKKYNGEKRLKDIIRKFLDDTRKEPLRIRFNLMLDESLGRILDKKSKTKNISKADYIRKLIEEDSL